MAFQRPRASSGSLPLSLVASLEEENREVLASLGKQRSRSPLAKVRSATPPAAVRSMLDVENAAPRRGSVAGIGTGMTSPREQRKPSARLDPSDPTTWTSPHTPTSSARQSAESFARSQESFTKPHVDFTNSFEHNYKFDIASMPTTGGGAIRNAHERRRSSLGADVSLLSSDSTLISSETNRVSTDEQRSPPNKFANPLILTAETPLAPAISLTESNPEHMVEDSAASKPSDSTNIAEGTGDSLVAERAGSDLPSDEDDQQSSSDDTGTGLERGRDRRQLPGLGRDGQRNVVDPADEDDEQGLLSNAESPGARNSHTLSGNFAPQSKGVRSLIEPLSSSTSRPEKSPDTQGTAGFGRSGPTAADFEDDPMEADIQKAKSLGLSISPVDDTVVDRHVRMVIRGEWARLQSENESSNHTSRLYLACTDLSTEAWYALEWTIGTMLRDGDTLLAINAIEDENAPKEPEGNKEVMVESAKAAHDTSETMNKLTRQTTNLENTSGKPMSSFIPVTEAPTSAGSVNAQNTSKREMERLRAMDEITQNFLKLVRKTSLQIRCMIEVIHCKSPKHLILNAIDELEPTLCVVGTRGRSSLKGVLLGSFSNYLVTKSSVPVMVARRRKKKTRHAKVNSASIRLSNNLTNSLLSRQRRGLENARID